MKKCTVTPDKRELLLVIGRLAGEIEQIVDALERVSHPPKSLHFHLMCTAQIEEARKTWGKFIRFIWLAVNWKIHSKPEIEKEISEIPVLKFLEVIYLFEQEVNQGIEDLETMAQWIIKNDEADDEYPSESELSLQSMCKAIAENGESESFSYLQYAEMISYFSEAKVSAYRCLDQANESKNNLRKLNYFIELATANSPDFKS